MNAQVSFFNNGVFIGTESYRTIRAARRVAKRWARLPGYKALVSY